MLITLKALILGIIEGLTEFIPVSSTGHLILAGRVIHFPEPFAQTFEIAIQLGAILAVVSLNWSFFSPFFNPKNWLSKDFKLIIVGCIPAAVLGVLIHHAIKQYLFNPLGVAIALIVGGGLMVITDSLAPSSKEVPIENMTYKNALVVGLFQCLSLWPGMSRSAATIMGGVWSGLGYRSSARYSFLVAVPLICAASLFDLGKSATHLTQTEFGLIAVGTITSFIVAIFSIRIFLSLLSRFKLAPFGYYRMILGAFIIGLEVVM